MRTNINNTVGLFGSRGVQGQTKVGPDSSIGKLPGQSINEGIRQIRSVMQDLRNILNNFDLKKLSFTVKDIHPDTIKKAVELATSSLKKFEMAMQGQSQSRPARQSPKPSISRDTGLLSSLNLNIPREERRAPAEFRRLFARNKEQSKTPQALMGNAGDEQIRRASGQAQTSSQLRQPQASTRNQSFSAPANKQAPVQHANSTNARVGRVIEQQAKGAYLLRSDSRREHREERIQREPRKTPKEQFRPSAHNPESFRIANPSNGAYVPSARAPRWDKEAVRKEEKLARILDDNGDPNMSSADVKRFLGGRAEAWSALDAKVAQQDAARSLAKKQALGDSKVRFQEQTRLYARLDKITNELDTKLNPDHPDYDLLADSHNRREILEKEQEKVQAKLKELEE